MTKQYTKDEDINKIISILKRYKEDDFHFTDYYWKRIALRDIDHDFLLQTFSQFDKIKLIEEDTLKRGDIGYDLHYELSNNRTLIVGVCPKKKLIFIHGILRCRSWANSLLKRR